MLNKSTSLIIRLLFYIFVLGAKIVLADEYCGVSDGFDVSTYYPEGDGYWVYGSNGNNGSLIRACTGAGKTISVVFDNKDSMQEFADLHILSIQSFYGLLVVTQESGSAYRIRFFAYDRKSLQIREMASDGSKFLPSLGYFGSKIQPVVSVIHSELESNISSYSHPKEEILYFFDKDRMAIFSKRRKWNPRY